METSIFLAKVIGFYLIIKLIAVWKNFDRLSSIIQGYKNNDALRFSIGLMTTTLGLLVVLFHNVWAWDFRIFITIIGWSVLIKGSLISFSPIYLDKISDWFMSKKGALYFMSVLSVALAAFLLYRGYTTALF